MATKCPTKAPRASYPASNNDQPLGNAGVRRCKAPESLPPGPRGSAAQLLPTPLPWASKFRFCQSHAGHCWGPDPDQAKCEAVLQERTYGWSQTLEPLKNEGSWRTFSLGSGVDFGSSAGRYCTQEHLGKIIKALIYRNLAVLPLKGKPKEPKDLTFSIEKNLKDMIGYPDSPMVQMSLNAQ